MKSVFWICFCVLLAGVVRCHNLRDVFVEGRIYFVDADCYSRMTRVRILEEHPGTILRHHSFENFPDGIASHATAPLDYLIVGLSWMMDRALSVSGSRVLAGQGRDLAGALISPLLGLLTCAFLGVWAARLPVWERLSGSAKSPLLNAGATVPFLFAISPILVHGTVLGRPDHQSLLVLLLSVALGAECRMAFQSSRTWSFVSASAWALALWVSLYEPLLLLAAVLLAWLVCAPRQLRTSDRKFWVVTFASISASALFLEGWRIHPLDPALAGYFGKWAQTIGELAHPKASDIFCWLGWGCLAALPMLGLMARRDRRAFPILALLAMLVGLTCWQARWGYFLALVYVMALPWQLALLRRNWIAWLFLAISLWPMAREWDQALFPDATQQQRIQQRRGEEFRLREVAERMRGDEAQPFLAPWWLSPALAYWSGQPGVAGSSHESLGGIVDSAHFYLSVAPEDAAKVLSARPVKWVVADDPTRVISTSSQLLGVPEPERPLATLLMEQPQSCPAFLTPIYANAFFKLFAVEREKLAP